MLPIIETSQLICSTNQIICFYMIGNTGRYTAWKVSKCGVISGPYFPIFGLNTEIISKFPYSIQIPENTDQK